MPINAGAPNCSMDSVTVAQPTPEQIRQARPKPNFSSQDTPFKSDNISFSQIFCHFSRRIGSDFSWWLVMLNAQATDFYQSEL